MSFLNASGAQIDTTSASAGLNGVTPTLKRVNTNAWLIPAGTVSIVVSVGISTGAAVVVSPGVSVAPAPPNIPVGSILNASHLLLEVCSSSLQATPSEWADIDAAGQVLDLFTAGSSAGLRVQGSTLPTFTGGFTITPSSESAVIAWASLVIRWPDAGVTVVQNGSVTISSLQSNTTYRSYPYFDIVNGGIAFVSPTSGIGSPPYLTAGYDANADAATRQDGRVALAPLGLIVPTISDGATSSSFIAGGSGGGSPIEPGGPALLQ